MIEELLGDMLYNMQDYLSKMEKSKNNDLETLKLGIIQEWDNFIPYGGVHDLGLKIINSTNSVAELEYEIDCLYAYVMSNIETRDVKQSIIDYRKRQLKKDFRKTKIK